MDYTCMFCLKKLILIVCFLTNLLVVKSKQVVRLNVQIKSDCLISLLVIILIKVKIEHAFEFIILCAIQFQLMVLMRCPHSKVGAS